MAQCINCNALLYYGFDSNKSPELLKAYSERPKLNITPQSDSNKIKRTLREILKSRKPHSRKKDKPFMKINKNHLPFTCNNPGCQKKYNLLELIEVLNLWGLVYAECGTTVIQGITCPQCLTTSLRKYQITDPLIYDLRDFILCPADNQAANVIEQLYLQHSIGEDNIYDVKSDLSTHKDIPLSDLYKFKIICAWEHDKIDENNLRWACQFITADLERIGYDSRIEFDPDYKGRFKNVTAISAG